MKIPKLVCLVVLTHVLVIGGVLCLQGCRTRPVGRVEPPPSPVLPPKPEEMVAPSQPVFHPPAPVEPAQAMLPPAGAQTYRVQKGDTLSKIAVRAGVSVRELIELNNIKDANKIRVGQTLVLPDYAKPLPVETKTSGESRATPRKLPKTESVKVLEGGAVHVVMPGDNLSKIAKKYGVKITDVRAANNLSGDLIRVGQKLVIPGREGVAKREVKEPVKDSQPAAAPALVPVSVTPVVAASEKPSATAANTPSATSLLNVPDTSTQTLQPVVFVANEGDTWERIAQLFVADLKELMALNNATDPNEVLKAGRKVLVPYSKAAP